MSQKAKKLTPRKDKKKHTDAAPSISSHESTSSAPEFANISIRINNFDNLQYLFDGDTKEELEIVAKYLNEKINSKDENRISESNKNSFEIIFGIRVNVNNEEEIFDICSNPILLTLLKHAREGEAVTLGHCNVDMLALCTPFTDTRTYRKHFERENFYFRKISFDCQISSDNAMLKKPYENILYVTIDSIHNIKVGGEITAGFKAPMNSQFTKFLTFTQNLISLDDKIPTTKQWFNLTQISGFGSKSNHHHEAYNFPHRCEEQTLFHNSNNHVRIDKIMRIILLNECENFLKNHIRREMKIAIEFMHDNRHMIGFVDAEDLLHVERKRVQVAIPLFEFNHDVMMKNCGYDSSWNKSKSINLMSDEIPQEIPVHDECGRKSFIVVELELEKPLNEELYEDSREDLTSEVNALKNENKLASLRENLQTFARNLLKDESNPSNAILNAISNGRFKQIKDSLLPSFYELTKDFLEPNENFEDFFVNFQCKLTSKMTNERQKLFDDQSKMLLAKFYQALGMEAEADEILLQEITKNDESEVAWLNCAVHYMRRQCYEKAIVCISEVLRINEISSIGSILKKYLDLKIGKIDECENIQKLIKKSSEMLDDFLSGSREVLWYSEMEDNLLSCHDNYVKFAVIFIKLGCFDIAEECTGEYYLNHGPNVNYFYLLAAIDALRGDYTNGLIHLNKIAENDVGNHNVNHSKILITICINLFLSGKHQNATDLFNKFVDVENCDNFLLLFLIGRFNNEIKNHEKALEILTKSSQMLTCELIFNELGKSYEKLENFGMAEKYFQRAVKCGCLRNSRDGWKNLFELFIKQNRVDAAKLCENFLNSIN